jgi:class 3 adenylate cyclase/tetratricopeptide (TPR) repeat protein
MQCPRCASANPGDARFCEDCGARLPARCPNCGGLVGPGKKFCRSCGAPLAAEPADRFASPETYTPPHLAEKIRTSQPALEGERKQVTVLFADLKGSMELLADRDPEAARALLDPVLERMMEAVHRYEGTVNQVMGDGIMALFGAPLAHEDHAVRAAYAALDLQAAMRRYTDDVRRRDGIVLQVRVGLNSGEVVVRAIGSDLHMDYTAVGQTTHLAARMEQLASPGTILLTADTLRLAEGYVAVKPLGPVPVKGMETPVEVYELVAAGPLRSRLHAAAARGLTRFVGRESELEQLRQALGRAGGGQGQVVALVGEAGVGKSRLVWEVTHSHRTHGWLVLAAGSVSYGKATPYLPVVDLLKSYFQVEDRDDHRRVRERVTGKLLALDEGLRPTLPAALALLDVPTDDPEWQHAEPVQRRRRTLDALKRWVLRESQVQPVLLVFEDLHWIDSETQTLLDSLVESLPTARVLLLVNYRPEYQHGWGGKSYYTQLRLDPLPPESVGELLQALLGGGPVLEPLKRVLLERTQGNPFFLEESVRTLVESGALAGERGRYALTQTLPAVAVPATVQAILAARIDRLPSEDKALLQTAAVIGKDVPLALLQEVTGGAGDALQGCLARLQAAEFLYETALYPDAEYTFKHALTHDVAYGSLLQERRRAIHARVVAAIETLYGDRLAEHVERLAHHAPRAGLGDKAVRYLHQAGVKAVARSANREAAELFEQALALLAEQPETPQTLAEAVDIRLALGPALIGMTSAGAPEVEASYAGARALCERLGDPVRLFPVLWGEWYVSYAQGRYRNAREIGERLLVVAGEGSDPAPLLEAHHALWATLIGMGDAVAARPHLERGMALYDRKQHRGLAFQYGGHDPGGCCRWFGSMSLWELGYPDQALQMLEAALALVRELAHPLSIAMCHYFAAWLHYHRGEIDAALETASVVRSFTEFPSWGDSVRALPPRIAAGEGQGAEHLDALVAQQRPSVHWRDVFSRALLADGYRALGQARRGLEVLAPLAGSEAECFYGAELCRIRGELILRGGAGDAAAAEARFRQALDIARARQERSFELRAATSLARLLQDQGRREQAREALAGIYGWFTEGFATRDLQEARAVLASLG